MYCLRTIAIFTGFIICGTQAQLPRTVEDDLKEAALCLNSYKPCEQIQESDFLHYVPEINKCYLVQTDPNGDYLVDFSTGVDKCEDLGMSLLNLKSLRNRDSIRKFMRTIYRTPSQIMPAYIWTEFEWDKVMEEDMSFDLKKDLLKSGVLNEPLEEGSCLAWNPVTFRFAVKNCSATVEHACEAEPSSFPGSPILRIDSRAMGTLTVNTGDEINVTCKAVLNGTGAVQIFVVNSKGENEYITGQVLKTELFPHGDNESMTCTQIVTAFYMFIANERLDGSYIGCSTVRLPDHERCTFGSKFCVVASEVLSVKPARHSRVVGEGCVHTMSLILMVFCVALALRPFLGLLDHPN